MDELKARWMTDAARNVLWDYEAFVQAKTPLDSASALVKLNESMHDLVTYMPEYDYKIGWMPEEG